MNLKDNNNTISSTNTNINSENDIIGGDLDLESLFEDEDLSLLEDQMVILDEVKPKLLDNPSKPISILKIQEKLNDEEITMYILLKNVTFGECYGDRVLVNEHTIGYLYPTLDNVYNHRYLERVKDKGDFEIISLSEFTEEMDNSIKNDCIEYQLFKNFLKIFTLRKGVKIK